MFGSSGNNGAGVINFNEKVNAALEEHKQRRAQNAKTHTLANGLEIRLKPVPPYLIDKVRKALKKPEPPVQVVEGVEHINTAHPDYDKALKEWERKYQEVSSRVMLELGCELDLTAEEMEAELSAVEAVMFAIDPSLDISQSAGGNFSVKYRYLIYVGLSTPGDIDAVIEKISGISAPSGQGVKENLDNFRG